MERKTRKKLAAVLVFFMLFSILPTAVFAAPAGQNQGIELQPYTSMEDLIQKAKAELIADGHVMETEPVNAVLVDAVESQTGRSFGEVKTAISQGLITDYETGVIDLERYGLSKDTLQDLMEYVLQQNYLVDDVTYSYDIQNGKIHFDMSEGKVAAFDSWNAMRESATNNTATQNAVASVSAQVLTDHNDSNIGLFSLRAEEENQAIHLTGCECTTGSALKYDGTNVTSINFIWEKKTVLDKDEKPIQVTDGEGKPVYTLTYDAETDSIVPKAKYEQDYQCIGATYTCPFCKRSVSVSEEEAEYLIDDSTTGSYPIEGQPFPYMDYKVAVLKLPVFDEQGNPMFDEKGNPALDEDGNPIVGKGILNVSMEDALLAYNEMAALIEGKSECFGVSTPYWTSKATAGNPFGAIKVVLNMEEDDEDIPGMYAMYIPQLTDGFAALVYTYEEPLLEIAQGAQDLMNRTEVQGLTDEYKLLLLHDWLANNAVFDMGSLLATRNGSESGAVGLESLLGMTPFTMLSTAIGYNGWCMLRIYQHLMLILYKMLLPTSTIIILIII